MKKKTSKKQYIITADQLLKFWGEDEPEEIAGYMASMINSLMNGTKTPEEFIKAIKPDYSDEVIAIADYFHIDLDDIEDNTEEYAEEYTLKLGEKHNLPIEWCLSDSDTVIDLGSDCFREVKINNKTYYWRWL